MGYLHLKTILLPSPILPYFLISLPLRRHWYVSIKMNIVVFFFPERWILMEARWHDLNGKELLFPCCPFTLLLESCLELRGRSVPVWAGGNQLPWFWVSSLTSQMPGWEAHEHLLSEYWQYLPGGESSYPFRRKESKEGIIYGKASDTCSCLLSEAEKTEFT